MADFLSTLVHELRTPLTALRGSLGLLSAVLPDDAPDAREFSDIAVRNAAKMVGLLDDLAAFVRQKQPDLAANIAPCDLAFLFEQTAKRTQTFAETRGVTVEFQVPSFGVAADEEMLRDTVARMVFYAVRVTPRDGRVCVSAEAGAHGVVVQVSDQGRPLADGDRDRFFEPFSPVARRGIDAFDRAGLDLAIAKLVAERHGGAIEFCPRPDGGAVRITLGRES